MNIYAPKSRDSLYLRGYREAYGEYSRDARPSQENDLGQSPAYSKGWALAMERRRNAFVQGVQRHSDYGWSHPAEDTPAFPPEEYRAIWDQAPAELLGLSDWVDFTEGWQAAHRAWRRGVWGHRTEGFDVRVKESGAPFWAVPDEHREGFALLVGSEEVGFYKWREFDKHFEPVGKKG